MSGEAVDAALDAFGVGARTADAADLTSIATRAEEGGAGVSRGAGGFEIGGGGSDVVSGARGARTASNIGKDAESVAEAAKPPPNPAVAAEDSDAVKIVRETTEPAKIAARGTNRNLLLKTALGAGVVGGGGYLALNYGNQRLDQAIGAGKDIIEKTGEGINKDLDNLTSGLGNELKKLEDGVGGLYSDAKSGVSGVGRSISTSLGGGKTVGLVVDAVILIGVAYGAYKLYEYVRGGGGTTVVNVTAPPTAPAIPAPA